MQNPKYEFLLFLVMLLLNLKDTQAFSQIGYEIKDLQETEFSLFMKEVEHWSSSSNKKVSNILITSGPQQVPILGGPEALKFFNSEVDYAEFQRIYTGLPPHESVTFTAKFWYFGDESEELNHYLDFFLEPISVNSGTSLDPEETEYQLHDIKFGYFMARRLHQSSQLILNIRVGIMKRPKKLTSLGFREITIHLGDYSTSDQSYFSGCFTSQEIAHFWNERCLCPFGQVLNKDSVCQSCAANCLHCFGPEPSQCIKCSEGMTWHGHECNNCHLNCESCTGPSFNECLGCSDGFYDYKNGTCLKTCEGPFEKVDKNLCTKYCKPNEYLWQFSRVCLASCLAPLVPSVDENGILLCKSPCLQERGFIYPNGSCFPVCPAPLVAQFEMGTKFCNNPCESTSDYLYANRSCLEECPAPLEKKHEPIANFCVNPCHSKNKYLYQNGSCLPACPFPGKIKEEFDVKYCLPPCDMAREYIFKDGSCSKECPDPLIRKTVVSIGTFCLSPCESEEHFLVRNKSCSLNCPAYFKTRIQHGVKYCLTPCLADQYYFDKNRSCLEECPHPFKVISEEGINLCKDQCPESFLYDDQSCHDDCPAPLRIDEGNYCKSPCVKENEYLNTYAGCQKSCEYPYKIVRQGSYKICSVDERVYKNTQMRGVREIIKISNALSVVGGFLSCLVNTRDPASIFMIPMLGMFEQIIGIDMIVLVDLEEVLTIQKGGGKKMERSEILARLKDRLEPFCLVLGIICSIYVLLSGIKFFFKENGRSQISKFLDWIWNIFAILAVSMHGDAVLYILLTDEFKGFRWSEIIESPRILNCLAAMSFTAFVAFKIMSFRRSMSDEQFNYERWAFIFEIYKSNGLFLWLYIIRMTLNSFVIGLLSGYPHVQAITILFMSSGMLIYMSRSSPIKKQICYIQHLVIEIGLSLYYCVFNASAIFDLDDESVRKVSGQLMEILYLVTSFITFLIILMKLLYKVYRLLFKTRDRHQAGHIQLREFSDREGDNIEQQNAVDEGELREINQQESDSEDSLIEADVVIE